MTTDPTILSKHFPHLRPLLKLPLSYTPNGPPALREETLRLTLSAIMCWHQGQVDSSEHRHFHSWSKTFSSEATTNLTRRFPNHPDPLHPSWLGQLADAKRRGLIWFASDKGNHLGISCPWAAYTTTLLAMTNDHRYTPTNLQPADIAHIHTQGILSLTGKSIDTFPLPPLYSPTIKDHKECKTKPIGDPFKWYKQRPVANCSGRGPRQLHERLQPILELVFQHHNPTTIVRSTAAFLQKLPTNTHAVYAYDVVGMYDAILHGPTLHALGILIREAFEAHPTHHISTRYKKARWLPPPYNSNSNNAWSYEHVMVLLEHVLCNDYVISQGICYHSSTGVPMGGPASELIATLAAYFVEREYLPIAKARWPWLFLLRYVDDANCNLLPYQFEGVFGPAFLAIGMKFEITYPTYSPSNPIPSLSFLDTTITCHPDGHLSTSHFSRREGLFPKDLALPHRGGATSHRSHSRLLFGLLLRFYIASSTLPSFLASIQAAISHQPSYTGREASHAAHKILSSPVSNRFALTNTQITSVARTISHFLP
jgi:hypothetical protein